MKSVQALRLVSLIEGISYLLLVGVAMPLKYVWDQPHYVRWVGSAHGFLFVAFVCVLVLAAVVRRWHPFRPLLVFVASMIPLGFIFIEMNLRRDLEELETAKAPSA